MNIEAVIKKTVNEAIKADRKDKDAFIKKVIKEAMEAGRRQEQKRVTNTYKATERRLYAYPDLKDKIESDQDYMYDIATYGLGDHSADIIRFQKCGVRLSDNEIIQGIIQDYTAKIAESQHEIKVIDTALAPLKSDPYFRVIPGKYFEGFNDNELAAELFCDPSTVRRNRSKLVNRLAIRLYGVDAL